MKHAMKRISKMVFLFVLVCVMLPITALKADAAVYYDIDYVPIGGISRPAAGETPDTQGKTMDDRVASIKISWKADGQIVKKFQGNRDYVCEITLVAKSGHGFSDESSIVLYDANDEPIVTMDDGYQISSDHRKLTGKAIYTVEAAALPESVKLSSGSYTIKKDDEGAYIAEYTAPAKKKASSATIPAAITVKGESVKVTSIAPNAFKNNTKLKTVVIGKNVQSIGANAFYKCSSLSKITIPAKVESIGKQAFAGCKKLKNITIKTKLLTAETIGKKAFKNVYGAVSVKVPKAKRAEYKKIFYTRGLTQNAKIK